MLLTRTALMGFLAVCLHSQSSPSGARSLLVDGIGQDASGVYVRMRNIS